MSKLLSIILVLMAFGACGTVAVQMGVLDFSKRRYHPCVVSEVTPPTAKLCYRYCTKVSFWSGKCQTYQLIVEDLNDSSTWNKFSSGDWIVISESFLQ